MKLDRDGDVFLLDLGDDENRFNPDYVAELSALVAEAEGASGPRALVTFGSGKFFSNGLDVQWMSANSERVPELVAALEQLLAQVLEAGLPTVAAVGGHAFGGGAMLALCHDQRVMRADRGYFCLPEIDLRLPFTPGMNALLLAQLAPAVAGLAMTTGRRYGGAEAAEAAIVHEAVGPDEVLSNAIARAAALANKDGVTLKTIKQRLYGPALAALRGGVS